MKACKGGKEALKGDTDALNGYGKVLKSDEEALKGRYTWVKKTNQTNGESPVLRVRTSKTSAYK